MKNLILLTLFLLGFTVQHSYAKVTKTETVRSILLKKGEGNPVEPKIAAEVPSLSLEGSKSFGAYSSIYTTIDEALVEITFDSDIQDLNILIKDKQGAIVYNNTFSVSASTILPISLEGYDSGDYVIEFTYGSTFLSGNFTL